MKFKGTWIFAAIVILVGGFAYYDYQKNEGSEETKSAENHAYKNIAPESVKTFTLRNSKGEFTLENNNGHWGMTAPLKDGIDHEGLDEFFKGFFAEDLKAMETEAKGEPNWAQFGLDKPLAHIEMTFNDGKKSSLDFGSIRAYDESYYVRRDGEAHVLLGSVGWQNYINRTAGDLRKKDLFWNAGEPVAFAVSGKGSKGFRFSQIDGKWQLDNQPGFKVDDGAINEYLNKLRHLSADRILSDEPRDPPLMRQYGLLPEQLDIQITVGYKPDATVKDLDLGWKLGIAATKTDRTAIYSSSNKPIYEIGTSKVAALRPDVSYFRNKIYPFQFYPNKAHQVRILKKGDKFEMRYLKLKGTWEIDVENPHEVLDPAKLEAFLTSLSGLSATKYFGRGQWNSKDIQQNRIQVLDEMQRPLFVFEWGGSHREQDQDFYLAKTNLADEVMSVSKTAVDEIIHQKLLKDPPPGVPTMPAAVPTPGGAEK